MTDRRLLAAGVILLCCLSGVAGGVGGAVLGLALANKSVEALSVEQAETLLVLAPLVGLLPEVCLLLLARKDPSMARLLPAALGTWLGFGAVSLAWLGLSPLLR